MGSSSGGGIVIAFPPHYTAQDIQAVKDISVWCAATARSTTALARMIGGSNGTMSAVLRGKYASSPSPILARVLKAAGQRLPKGWEALLPVDEPALPVVCEPVQTVIPPTPTRPVMTAWEPGAISTREKGLREQINRLVSKHSSQNPMDLGELLNRLGNTPEMRSALDGMVADRELLMAKVSRFGNTHVVIYPVGRVPVERPGRRATAKPRGPNIVITPSTRSGAGKGSRP
jgi:hypothetical protein